MGRRIETAAQSLETFTKSNEAREHAEQTRANAQLQPAAAAAPAPAANRPRAAAPSAKAQTLAQKAADMLKGMVMSEETRTLIQPPPKPRAASAQPLSPWSLIWPVLALLGLLAGVRWRGVARAHA